MRLAERTIELNFCAQLSRLAGRELIWFGLTQRQEAHAGFDAATRLGRHLYLFQLKASNHVLRDGSRRFRAKHGQLRHLQQRAPGPRRSVFYVFPMVGTTLELSKAPDLINHTWLLDVRALPNPFPSPTVRGGYRNRKSRLHYVDVRPPTAVIHSEVVEVSLLHPERLASELATGEEMDVEMPGLDLDTFDGIRRAMSRRAVGVFLA